MRKSTIQFYLAVTVVAFTIGISIAGFCVSPPGKVDSSILALIGEFLSFAAALFGFTSKYHRHEDTPHSDTPTC